MIDPDDSILIFINYKQEFFGHCFSKMEFIMGMDYISEFADRYNIPVVFTERHLNYPVQDRKVMERRTKKEENRKKNMAPPSTYDKKFIEDFSKKIHIVDPIKVEKEDIFYHSNVEEKLRSYNRNTLLFGGFFTDTDVFISSINAGIREFRSLVVSDLSSTYSERLYFQSLEMISQFIDVIDTRDLMKIFEP
ncbi:MAG: isochorismatase family protein [Ferroplasma sp.]